MKIIQRALTGSLIATGLGLVFMSGAYAGCKTLGKSMKILFPGEYSSLKRCSKILRTNEYLSDNVKTNMDFIYQSLK